MSKVSWAVAYEIDSKWYNFGSYPTKSEAVKTAKTHLDSAYKLPKNRTVFKVFGGTKGSKRVSEYLYYRLTTGNNETWKVKHRWITMPIAPFTKGLTETQRKQFVKALGVQSPEKRRQMIAKYRN